MTVSCTSIPAAQTNSFSKKHNQITKFQMRRIKKQNLPSKGSLVRPSWLMMYLGISVLMPWPTLA